MCFRSRAWGEIARSQRGWLTPDEPAADTICRLLLIPNSVEFQGLVDGALMELTFPYNYEQYGTLTPQETAQIMAEMLWDFGQIPLPSGCEVVPAPYYDDPESADDAETTDEQPWYGEMEGLTFTENVAIWGITGFIAYSGQIGAAIAFKTFAPKFVLAWRKSGVGGAIRVFIDGIDQGLLDTYDPAGGVLEVPFDAGEAGVEHEIIQVLESVPPPGFAPFDVGTEIEAPMQVIRKRLYPEEADVITDLRQVAGSGQLEMFRGGEWENVPTADNVRKDGTVVMTDALSVLSTAGIVARFNRNATGGAIFNIGGALTDGSIAVRSAITASLAEMTLASWKSRVAINVRGAGGAAQEWIKGEMMTGFVPGIGVLGKAAAVRQTVTGGRNGSPALEQLLLAMELFGWINDDSTAGTPPTTRYNPDCDCFEITVDGGLTWTEDPELDPRHAEGSRIAPLTGTDTRCRAAEGMTSLVRETVNVRVDAVSAIELAGAILGIVAFIPGFNLLYALVLALAFLAFTIGRELLEAAFTEDVYDQIRCIFYCNIDEDGQMSAAQFAAAYAELISLEPIPRTWVQQVMTTFGEVGLSDAGVMFEGAADCECPCECEPYSDPMTTELGELTHIATWNATDISQFPVVPGTFGVYNPSGGVSGGGYLQGVNTGDAEPEQAVVALIDLERVCTITEVSWQRLFTGGGLQGNYMAMFDASQTRLEQYNPGDLLPGGWTGIAWTGTPVAGVRYIMIWAWVSAGGNVGLDDIAITVA